MDRRPIGVFDSGLGGLTVVRKLMKLLPNEDIIYFGDTGRVPYGSRSVKILEKYTRQDCNFLMSKHVKMIIAACGTVSSVAPHVLTEFDIPAFGVVEPAAKEAVLASKNGKIGVLATVATIRADAFGNKIRSISPDAHVFNQACSLFVPLVENGWIAPDDEVTNLTAKRYLKPIIENKADTVILGCTHFPMLKRNIGEIIGSEVKLIDTGNTTAAECKAVLEKNDMINNSSRGGEISFYVSDHPDDFSRIASMFLGREINSDVHLVEVF